MSKPQHRSASDSRPSLNGSRSFTRMDERAAAVSPRKRAATLQDAGIPPIPEARQMSTSPELIGKKPDVFDNTGDDEHEQASGTATPNPELRVTSSLDDLPIEIRSLTERFLEGLSAKVHPTPLTAEALSDLFQDFYERAAAHISTHIASLASKIGREKSPAKSAAKGRASAGSGASRGESPGSTAGGEMLTVSEVADRRKARRMLEVKRVALEEAVERAVCEKIYERIWKHRSTDDDARDEKLRSRTAALTVVGIGLKELHLDVGSMAEADADMTVEEKEAEIHGSLTNAREALRRMDDEHYPLGKLQHLTAAHKSIVETLSELFPKSSSADEILPTLIYTLITSPPEGINAVSNCNFIQRFRTSTKVDGEAAYCLVNLEAAISFLETVDLSSLRADELPGGPPKSSSRPTTPTTEKTLTLQQAPSAHALKPNLSPVSVLSADTGSSPTHAAKALPSPRTPNSLARPEMHQRRLSNLIQAQADRMEASRDELLSTADKVYESINNTMENSFQFVFGRFTQHAATGDSPLPKTLEDARRLVSSPATPKGDEDDILYNSGQSSPALDADPLAVSGTSTTKAEAKMLDLIGGRKPPHRDRSVDSTRSGGSGKRVAFSEVVATQKTKDESIIPGANLFAQINPLNRFGVPGFAKNFGRTVSGNTTTTLASPPANAEKRLGGLVESPRTTGDTEPFPTLERQRTAESGIEESMNAKEALAELRKLKPPRKRFLEVKDASELRIGEVEDLLKEYRRLAKAIGQAVAI